MTSRYLRDVLKMCHSSDIGEDYNKSKPDEGKGKVIPVQAVEAHRVARA
jgi:hypothetical protein